LRYKVYEPVLVVGEDKFATIDIRVRVKGGGHTSQIYAIRQAIARAVVAFYAKFYDAYNALEIKKQLVSYDRSLLIADPRRQEPKKFGGGGARARRQKRYALVAARWLAYAVLTRGAVTVKHRVPGRFSRRATALSVPLLSRKTCIHGLCNAIHAFGEQWIVIMLGIGQKTRHTSDVLQRHSCTDIVSSESGHGLVNLGLEDLVKDLPAWCKLASIVVLLQLHVSATFFSASPQSQWLTMSMARSAFAGVIPRF